MTAKQDDMSDLKTAETILDRRQRLSSTPKAVGSDHPRMLWLTI